jgi:hypothetical protein
MYIFCIYMSFNNSNPFKKTYFGIKTIIVFKIVSVLLLSIIVLTLALALVSQIKKYSSQAAGTTSSLFVSPTGDDTTGDGSIATPYKTLEKARDQVRTLTPTMTSDITVNLRGGTYKQNSTFQLNEQDSGQNGFRVYYQAYNNEVPIISGGEPIAGSWSLYDNAKNIYRVQVGTLATQPRSLLVNDTFAVRARSEENPTWLTRTNGQINFDSAHGYLSTTMNKLEMELGATVDFTQNRCLPTSVTSTEIILEANCTSNYQQFFGANGFAYGPNGKNWIENVYELLDSDNEWYYNKTDGFMYYKPVGSVNPNTQQFVIPQVETLITVKGNLATNTLVSNITFKGLTLKYGTWELFRNNSPFVFTPQSFFPGGDLYVRRQSLHQIETRYAKNLIFDSNTITATDGGGIWFGDGTSDSTIIHNSITNIGAQGITIGNIIREPASISLRNINNTVYNNLVSRYSILYPDAIGIISQGASGSIITHNEVSFGGYTGISIGHGLQNMDYTQSRNSKLMYNNIHHVMQKLKDGGPIYIQSVEPNLEISHNYLHDTQSYPGAIYPDSGTTFTKITDNVVKVVDNVQQQWTGNWLFSWNLSQTNNKYENNFVSTGTHLNVTGPFTNNTYANNQVFTTDTQFPQILPIINASGLCSVKNDNIHQCDIVGSYCPNGEVNPPICNNTKPEGSFDKIVSDIAYAWAKDPNSSSPVQVEAFVANLVDISPGINYVKSIGSFTCDKVRVDSHTGFGCEIPIPAPYTSNKYAVYLMAKDTTDPAQRTYLPLFNHDYIISSQNLFNPFVCTPSQFLINTPATTATCVTQLPPTPGTYITDPLVFNTTYNANVGGLYVAVKQNDNPLEDYLTYGYSDLCTINVTTVTCTNVGIGSIPTIGQKTVIGAVAYKDFIYTGGKINYVSSLPDPLTPAQLDTALSCTPITQTVGGTVTCSGTLPANTAITGVGILVGSSTTPVNCTIAGLIVTCPVVSVGVTAGSVIITASTLGGTVLTNIPVETITVTNPTPTPTPQTQPLTPTDIPAITFSCNNSQSVPVNSTTTCTFTLPTNKTLPPNFYLGIGNGSSNSSKVAQNNTFNPLILDVSAQSNTQIATIQLVPTGSQTGVFPIYAYLNGTQINTGETVQVIANTTLVSLLPRTGGVESSALILVTAFCIGTIWIASRVYKGKNIPFNGN